VDSRTRCPAARCPRFGRSSRPRCGSNRFASRQNRHRACAEHLCALAVESLGQSDDRVPRITVRIFASGCKCGGMKLSSHILIRSTGTGPQRSRAGELAFGGENSSSAGLAGSPEVYIIPASSWSPSSITNGATIAIATPLHDEQRRDPANGDIHALRRDSRTSTTASSAMGHGSRHRRAARPRRRRT
jgi:hypothetical protein